MIILVRSRVRQLWAKMPCFVIAFAKHGPTGNALVQVNNLVYKIVSESSDIYWYLCSYCPLACYQKEKVDLSENLIILSSQAA